MPANPPLRLVPALLIALGLLAPGAHAAPARDTLVMLVPDGANVAAWPVKVWTDSAAEEGIRLKTMTDAQFLALGTTAAAQIAGERQHDGQRETHRDRGIDRVAALTHDLHAGLAGQVMHRGDHAPTRFLGGLTDGGQQHEHEQGQSLHAITVTTRSPTAILG